MGAAGGGHDGDRAIQPRDAHQQHGNGEAAAGAGGVGTCCARLCPPAPCPAPPRWPPSPRPSAPHPCRRARVAVRVCWLVPDGSRGVAAAGPPPHRSSSCCRHPCAPHRSLRCTPSRGRTAGRAAGVAPQVRAMQIIDELETLRRGALRRRHRACFLHWSAHHIAAPASTPDPMSDVQCSRSPSQLIPSVEKLNAGPFTQVGWTWRLLCALWSFQIHLLALMLAMAPPMANRRLAVSGPSIYRYEGLSGVRLVLKLCM